MRTIAQIVAEGITTVVELQEALYLAMKLEFSTIPPYLCAQWSINSSNNGDPSGVSGLILGVVVQEMLHFGLACNMYTATGGSLSAMIATPDFVPQYPTSLPGGVHPGLVVSLAPVGTLSLQTFMSIEYPDGTPVVQEPPAPPAPQPPGPPTIGDFYATIKAGFNNVYVPNPNNPNPPVPWPNNPSLNQVVAQRIGPDTLYAINSVQDALTAISQITAQGEGTSTSPDEGTFDPNNLAHYYTFAEIYFGAKVAQTGSDYGYTGTPVQMPAVYNFAPETPNSSDQQQFVATFTLLMQDLEKCWTSNSSIEAAITTMITLQTKYGVPLIQSGFTPLFAIQE